MNNSRQTVFNYLMSMNEHDGAPVKLSIGAVIGGIVRHNFVVVHNAPPRIVSEIVSKFRGVSLHEDGLYIPLNESE